MAQDNDENGAVHAPGGVKVELDIDDAPFLEEDEPQAEETAQEALPEPEAVASAPEREPEAPGRLAAFFANRKRLYLIAGGLVFLLVTPLLLMLVFSGKKAPPPEPAGPQRITQELTLPRTDAPAGPAYLYRADAFFVPLKGSEGEPRFLRCDFAVPTDNPQLYAELMAKNIAVRDSIYYYLHNKPLSFLADQKSRQLLRQDIISVVNEHASAEKIKELYIENYLISGK